VAEVVETKLRNARLVEVSDGRVTFRYKDYADASRSKTMTLPAEEFLRRFVQHVLPNGCVNVRRYGLLANAQREARLHACRRLVLAAVVAPAPPQATGVEPAEPRCCANCGGTRLVYREIDPADLSRSAAQDSS
jgi:hypothetical protein